MRKSIEIIKKVLDASQMRYGTLEEPDSLVLALTIKDGPRLPICIAAEEDTNDLTICVYGIVEEVPKDREAALLRVINSCYVQWRYVRFTIDRQRRLDAEYDVPKSVPDDALFDTVADIAWRMTEIVNACYPVFMRALEG